MQCYLCSCFEIIEARNAGIEIVIASCHIRTKLTTCHEALVARSTCEKSRRKRAPCCTTSVSVVGSPANSSMLNTRNSFSIEPTCVHSRMRRNNNLSYTKGTISVPKELCTNSFCKQVSTMCKAAQAGRRQDVLKSVKSTE